MPVMTGYVVLGIGFGVLLQSKGYSALWAGIMGIIMYAGTMQYVAIDLMASAAGLVSTAILSLMVSARQLFYGLAMVDKYRDVGKIKPYLIFALPDETYSLVCDPDLPEDVDLKGYYFYVSLFNHIAWVVGDILGALVGSWLTFDTTGIDFVMTAIFVVIFMEQWEKTKQHLPAILGVGVTVVCRVFFGATSFLIPAMLGITVGLFAMRKTLDPAQPAAEGGQSQ
jgi:4-azaleucine resistance transporter AzlC